ncbi:hypothetical protein [Undibacterium luofuense]|uniref:Lipoprotein n=1 Tax=Undibacterium luofuense TaxID=2828733 RepID=A0A941DNA4_9BURK|nr:hypothetical protein [Undibacterium luofuense]MBR7782677.1 hypothetical protein [Undibacterium luofuense]
MRVLNKKIFLLCFLFVFSMSSNASEEKDAMFGLKWGMTKNDFEKLGIAIVLKKKQENLTIYKSSSVPKPLSGFSEYSYVFSDEKLVKIVATGDTIFDDAFGEKGKERFSNLHDALTQKYGEQETGTKTVGLKLYKESDEFYECLRYQGCGMWTAIFKTNSKSIVLDLVGVARGKGYVNIMVEAVPEFKDAIQQFNTKKNKLDAGAL